MAVFTGFTRSSKVARFKTSILGNTGQHSWADFLAIMEGKDIIRISDAFKSLV